METRKTTSGMAMESVYLEVSKEALAVLSRVTGYTCTAAMGRALVRGGEEISLEEAALLGGPVHRRYGYSETAVRFVRFVLLGRELIAAVGQVADVESLLWVAGETMAGKRTRGKTRGQGETARIAA